MIPPWMGLMDTDRWNVARVLMRIQPLARELEARENGNKRGHFVRGKEKRLMEDEKLVRAEKEHQAWLAECRKSIRSANTKTKPTKKSLSPAQVDKAIQKLVEATFKARPLDQQTGESLEDWKDRINQLHHNINELWTDNRERIIASHPKYVNGLPARDTLKPPRFFPHFSRKPTGLLECLQCKAKGLPCSRVSIFGGQRSQGSDKRLKGASPEQRTADAIEKLSRERCQRCVRNGEPCLVWKDQMEEGEGEAIYHDMGDLGSDEEIHEMLEQLYEGVKYMRENERLEIIGSRMEKLALDNFVLPMRQWKQKAGEE
jgi:hypothetical protein